MPIRRIAALALCLILNGAAAAQGMTGHGQHEHGKQASSGEQEEHSKHHGGSSGHGATRERPADLDVARTRTSNAHRFEVSIQPQHGPAAINRMHAWIVHRASPWWLPRPNSRREAVYNPSTGPRIRQRAWTHGRRARAMRRGAPKMR